MNTTTLTLHEGYFSRRSPLDWGFAALLAAAAAFVFARYNASLDVYEKFIMAGLVPAGIWLAWFWRPLRTLMLVVAVFSLLGIYLYHGELASAEKVFGLKYFLSSQSAIMWMSVLFFMSTIFYWLGVFMKGQRDVMQGIASKMAWVAVGLALIGTMVR
ncbi:MAG: c-type cytochrome biogenesis protein CcsB, partial [Burkholderiaceae bacterium]